METTEIKQKIKKTSLFPVKNKSSSLPPIKEMPSPAERTFLYALKKGSLTVECALVFPAFFLAVITLISIMGLFGSAVRETVVLRNRAETAAEAINDEEAGKWVRLYSYVSSGSKLPYDSAFGIRTLCAAKVRIWNGRGSDDYKSYDKGGREEYVYVAETGSVYHTDNDCTHIDLDIRSIPKETAGTVRNEYGAHYHPCEKCAADEEPGAYVYIAAYGDRYHNDENCSGITRTVRLIPKEEAHELPLCERCAAKARKAA